MKPSIQNKTDEKYLKVGNSILYQGNERMERTGTGTYAIFGTQTRYDLREGFPLLTTKAVHIPSVIHELLMFVNGITDNNYLTERGVRIWNEWAKEDGDLGKIYGYQWRSWEGSNGETHDQLQKVIETLKTNPTDRRMIVSAWNVAQLDEMALPPCHMLFQFFVRNGELSCQLYQRSADWFLGVPFNIASYSALVHMIAEITGLKVGEFIHTTGDTHIYSNHVTPFQIQQQRTHRKMPTLRFNPNKKYEKLEDFTFEDFIFEGYNPHPKIKASVSV